MTVISVPALEEEPYPSLGPLVCDWIESNLVFGPGDLQGQPARLDDEKRALIWRFYELLPQGTRDANGKVIAGRRRFRRCAVSLQKGSAKTELAAWIAAAELHPEAPVRFDHFDGHGQPWGHGLPSVYIPMVAYTSEQAEDLAYGVLKDILERSKIAADFDIGWERIVRVDNPSSKAVALAGAPDARDGALTTFEHFDETHRQDLPRQKRAVTTMLANLTKRLMADPWALETTTAYSPGENSVAEDTAAYAAAVAEGKVSDPRLFYFHRQSSDSWDWSDAEQRRQALVEAAGPTAAWKDIEGISELWQNPKADRAYLERVYGNRPISTASQAFNVDRFMAAAYPKSRVKAGEKIVLGFDGSIRWDSTGFVATHARSGFQWVPAVWERPENVEDWEVPRDEVDSVLEELFATYEVLLVYMDPSKWESEAARWAGRYGSKVIVAWPTTLYRKMAVALKAYATAIEAGEVKNNGDPVFTRHIGAAQRNVLTFLDDDGSPLWLIQKDRPGSPNKIDLAMAGCLSWTARNALIATGVLDEDDYVGVTFV